MSAVPANSPGVLVKGREKDPRPAADRRAAARQALVEGRAAEGKAALRRLWEEEPGPDRVEDAVLLMAALAREGEIDEPLVLLEQGRQARLSTASLADLAAAFSTNLPSPGMAVVRIQSKVPTTRSAAHAGLVARLTERTGDVRGAVPLWEIAARLAPEESSYHRELTRLYAITGNPRGLESALRSLVELEPRDLSARVNLVRTLARAGRLEEAREKARLPEKLLSGTEAELSAGEVLLRAGLAEESLAVFDAVLKDSPNDCEARYGRARALVAGETPGSGEKELHALVARKVGDFPCRVVSAVRELAARPTWPAHRRRLLKLKKRGGGADPAALEGVLSTLGDQPLSHRPRPGTTPHRRVGPSHYAIDGAPSGE